MPIDNNLSDHLVHVTDRNLGLNPMWRLRFTSIGSLIVEKHDGMTVLSPR